MENGVYGILQLVYIDRKHWDALIFFHIEMSSDKSSIHCEAQSDPCFPLFFTWQIGNECSSQPIVYCDDVDIILASRFNQIVDSIWAYKLLLDHILKNGT